MSVINCAGVNPNFKKLLSDIREWAGKSSTKKFIKDPYEAAFSFAETEMHLPLDQLMHLPVGELTPGQVGSFKGRLNELISNMESGKIGNWTGGNLSTWFYNTSKYGKRDPVIGSILGKMQKSSHKFRANELENKTLFRDVVSNLDSYAVEVGFTSKMGRLAAKRRMSALDDARLKAHAEVLDRVEGAKERYDEIEAEIDRVKKDTHLQVYDEFINIIEKDISEGIAKKYNDIKIKADKDRADGKTKSRSILRQERLDRGDEVLKLESDDLAKYLEKIHDKPKLYQAVDSYVRLMDNMYSVLRNGVDVRIDSVIKRLTVNGDTRTAKEFKELKNKLRDIYMPKYEQGFFPHFTRDLNAEFMDGLMKSFDSVQRAVNPYDMKGEPIRDIINSINLHINKHVKRRAEKSKESGEKEYTFKYSRDLIGAIDNYVFDVNRFNYAAFMDSHMIDALTSIESMYRTEGSAKGYAKVITDYVLNMTKAANGDSNVDPTMKAIMRTALGFEFVSKMGVNPRGAAKNWFQRLLDYATWTPHQIKTSSEYLQNLGTEVGYVEGVLRTNGLLYAEASPQAAETLLASKASASKIIEYDETTGKHVANVKSKYEMVADGMGVVASKASFMHRAAENSNRKHTFKIAYGQLHKWLNNPMYRNKLSESGVTGKSQDIAIRKAAENYAINMTILNHFDYADYAKGRAITSTAGRFLGQFQHYSFEFVERITKDMREAKYDISEGQYAPWKDAHGIRKVLMTNILYFLPVAIGASLMGLNLGNLIQHDTAERINMLAQYLTGDLEEKQSAFYGKGPILGTLGGPLLSDILEIGMFMDLINTDEDGWYTILTGMERLDPHVNTKDWKRKIRILNTFSGRLFDRHIPQFAKGRPFWALQSEFGIYPTAEARKMQKKRKKLQKKLIPKEINDVLKALEEGSL